MKCSTLVQSLTVLRLRNLPPVSLSLRNSLHLLSSSASAHTQLTACAHQDNNQSLSKPGASSALLGGGIADVMAPVTLIGCRRKIPAAHNPTTRRRRAEAAELRSPCQALSHQTHTYVVCTPSCNNRRKKLGSADALRLRLRSRWPTSLLAVDCASNTAAARQASKRRRCVVLRLLNGR